MSLIKPGFGIAALSGKLGGTIYARNRGGMYAKAWVDPTNPETPDQLDKWAIWTAAASAFGALTRDQLNQWDTYTTQLTRLNRLGERFQLTAQQIFYECFTNASLIDQSPITLPSPYTDRPAITNGGTLEALEADSILTQLQLSGHTVICPSGDNGRLIISAAPISRPSLRNVNNKFRIITHEDAGTDPIKLITPYINKFNNEAPFGHIAHLRLRVIDQLSYLGSTRVLINTELIAG